MQQVLIFETDALLSDMTDVGKELIGRGTGTLRMSSHSLIPIGSQTDEGRPSGRKHLQPHCHAILSGYISKSRLPTWRTYKTCKKGAGKC